ncbi:two-component system sensor histidine kinase AlgZ [Melaminivora alkalimesophila]|uniref:Two-component system sensor histidine kinase AlgZ n=2 Tax=Melaminivora alkalimesophila TaxID=1165852 RepID=A0A317RAL8_9BURK|nr:histidine kinase [Melaminivora alkalimesophila]PWW46016.1 two-component system sensor histidine kinase AlgZ [Melaminivora alkalimesophila]
MQKQQILSTPSAAADAQAAAVFDACHVGVVLRAVLLVELVLAVAAMFGAAAPAEWLARLALLTGGALPATLAWLLVACAAKRLLARLDQPRQYAAGALLGALAGLAACALLALADPLGFEPPWLASAATGALMAALLVAALGLRARAQLPAATAARLTELQARIRPHFLFNTLNSAIALVQDEPARAEALLEDLGDLFRHALVEQGEATTLAEEVELARKYLAIEAVRFGERMRVQWVLDERAGSARVPPLLLQPLVENAVKHGVEPSTGGTAKLRICTELRGERVVLSITNTLPARTGGGVGTAGHGIAQANVRERLRLLHDVDCDFRAGPHKGLYHVRISLPAR